MLVTEQNLFFWNLAYELVTKHRFHIIHFDQAGEVWLESPKNINGAIIRLKREDIDWAKWLERDIEFTEKNLKKLRSSQLGRKVKVMNVYVSAYAPVDSWEHLLDKDSKVTTVLIEGENRKEGITQLFEMVGLELPSNPEAWLYGDENTVLLMRETLMKKQEQELQEAKQIFSQGKPFITYILIAVNLLMFGVLELNGGSTNTSTLIQFGAKYNPSILDGEWWRLITPMFLHIGFFHLFMNTLALYYLGTAVERIYGSVRFLFIYFAAAVAGAAVSFALQPEVSAGASGAIFGCFGALLYFGVIHPSLFFRTMGMNVIFVIGLNLLFGFSVPMVDNSAHIGGLVGGFLASAVVQLPKLKLPMRSIAAFLLLLGLTGGFIWYGWANPTNAHNPYAVGVEAEQLLQDGEYEQAYERLVHFMEENDDTLPELLYYRAFAELQLGKYDDAKENLQQVINERHEFHNAYYLLAVVHAQVNELEKAEEHAQKAVKLAPDNKDYRKLMEDIQAAKKNIE